MRVLTAALLTVAACAPARPLQILWVDVEGGAATLIVSPSGESLLVDTGNPGTRDAERIHHVAAKVAGLTRIDHLLTTHWHSDHFGGIARLAELMPIGAFYDHGFPEGAPKDVDPALKAAYLKLTGGRAVRLAAGDAIPLAGLRVRVLASDGLVLGEAAGSPQTRPCADHPAKPDDASDNARSAGFLLSFGAFDFLDLGDLTWNVEHKLICPKNLVGTVDLYQVTHHGQDNSNHPALVGAVAPTVAVMNNGPRKGGKAPVFKILREMPSIRDVYQLHRNVDTTAGDNAPPEFTANAEAACAADWVRVTVEPSGDSFTVEVPSKGTSRTYRSR